jgi:Flagellin and related hook-associated proteins
MVINHNIAALNTYNKLSANETNTENSLEKLSSGKRINKAADDAAGLAISQKMQQQINGLDTASSNAQNGISLIQTAEGALSESQDILQRMNELAVQAANGTNTTADASKLQDEVTTLQNTLNSISDQTTFNGKAIFKSQENGDGLFSTTGIQLQVGAAQTDTTTIGLSSVTSAGSGSALTDITAASLGVAAGASGISLTGATTSAAVTNANNAITNITNAIDTVSKLRSKLGAYQNQLTHTINNLGTESENLNSAVSSITDVDMAKEMTNYTKNNILVQSAEAMLAQANQLPQGVLSLLK